MDIIFFLGVCYIVYRLFFHQKKRSRTSNSSESNYFGNRCHSCNHFNSIEAVVNRDGSRTMVHCPINGLTRVSSGCSSFVPDITASCLNCIHRVQQDTPKFGEMCAIHGRISGIKNYCPDAVYKDYL